MKQDQHFDTETILDALEGRAQPQAREDFHKHLSVCAACRQSASEWAGLLDVLTGIRLQSAPVEVVRRASELPEAGAPDRRPLERVIASLVSDSWLQPAAVGLRGGGDARHLLLAADHVEVHLRVTYGESVLNISGQLFDQQGRDIAGNLDVVVANGSGATLTQTRTDEFGEFRFDHVAVHGRTVTVSLPDGEQVTMEIPMEGEGR